MSEAKSKVLAAVEAAREAQRQKEDKRKEKITVSMEVISAAKIKEKKKGC